MKFNNNFLIGAATAAHQVEGNNVNSDSWVIEQMPGSTFKEPSLDTVDHYNRYREDIKLLAMQDAMLIGLPLNGLELSQQKVILTKRKSNIIEMY